MAARDDCKWTCRLRIVRPCPDSLLEGVPEHVLAQLEEYYRAHYVPAYVQAFRIPYERTALGPLDGDCTLHAVPAKAPAKLIKVAVEPLWRLDRPSIVGIRERG